MDPLVRLTGVAKRFPNGTLALDRVDLAISRGSFVSLLGPSGCGKSTILRMIAGLVQPSAGRIDWPGLPEAARTGAHPELGFVFQQPTLMPWASVADNIRLPLKVAGVAKADADARIAEAISMVGLEGFAQAFPRELSGGMQMRASIARALVTDPDLLLMDEPFGALDHQTRELMQELLLGIWEAERTTVLFVTHDIDEAVFMGSRVVVMSARPGRIKLDRNVELPHPRHYSVKTTPAFMALKAELTEAVRAEVLAAQTQAG